MFQFIIINDLFNVLLELICYYIKDIVLYLLTLQSPCLVSYQDNIKLIERLIYLLKDQNYRKEETDKDLPPAGFLPRRLEWPGLGETSDETGVFIQACY